MKHDKFEQKYLTWLTTSYERQFNGLIREGAENILIGEVGIWLKTFFQQI